VFLDTDTNGRIQTYSKRIFGKQLNILPGVSQMITEQTIKETRRELKIIRFLNIFGSFRNTIDALEYALAFAERKNNDK